MKRSTESLADRFWSKVDRRGPNECWPWKASMTAGRGQLHDRQAGRPLSARRLAWEQANGPIGDDLQISTSCETSACCNPAHLISRTVGGPKPISPHLRVMEKVEMITESGCWIFMGTLTSGYGRISVSGGSKRALAAHRVTYEHYRGPIPEGLTLDHVKERCSSRACVNPWHLEPVTLAENIRRGNSPPAKCARKPCCPKCGGPWELVNWPSTGPCRTCRPCDRIKSRNRRLRARLLVAEGR